MKILILEGEYRGSFYDFVDKVYEDPQKYWDDENIYIPSEILLEKDEVEYQTYRYLLENNEDELKCYIPV